MNICTLDWSLTFLLLSDLKASTDNFDKTVNFYGDPEGINAHVCQVTGYCVFSRLHICTGDA